MTIIFCVVLVVFTSEFIQYYILAWRTIRTVACSPPPETELSDFEFDRSDSNYIGIPSKNAGNQMTPENNFDEHVTWVVARKLFHLKK